MNKKKEESYDWYLQLRKKLPNQRKNAWANNLS